MMRTPIRTFLTAAALLVATAASAQTPPPVPAPEGHGRFWVIVVSDPDGREWALPFRDAYTCQAVNQVLQVYALRDRPGTVVSTCKLVIVADEEWSP
jgi:hypothetical protein